VRFLEEKELENIVATYFGLTPSRKLSKDVKIERVEVRDAEEIEEAKKLRIKWDNHIGSETKVGRITPLDILHYLKMSYTSQNYGKAVKILKYIAKRDDLPLFKVGDEYLLINPKRRR